MRNLFSPFWVGFTVVLTILLIVLLPLSILSKWGLVRTLIFTSLGVIFIWAVYFIRAWIFSGFEREKNNETGKVKAG